MNKNRPDSSDPNPKSGIIGRILSSFESLSAIGAVPGPRTAAAFARLHRADFIAGLSVIGLLLPEAVAYAGIAGMPPASGLIALFCGLACYLLIGRSRFAIVSATSSSALVLAVGVATLSAVQADADPETLAAVLVMMTGFWFLLARLLGFGRASNFVAKPVLRGVTMGLSLTITLMQLPKLFTLTPDTMSPFGRLFHTVQALPTLSPASLRCRGARHSPFLAVAEAARESLGDRGVGSRDLRDPIPRVRHSARREYRPASERSVARKSRER